MVIYIYRFLNISAIIFYRKEVIHMRKSKFIGRVIALSLAFSSLPGVPGFISSSNSTITANATYPHYMTVTASQLRVRKAPGTQYTAIGTADRGMKVYAEGPEELGWTNGYYKTWYYITYTKNNKTYHGWACSDYLVG